MSVYKTHFLLHQDKGFIMDVLQRQISFNEDGQEYRYLGKRAHGWETDSKRLATGHPMMYTSEARRRF